MAQFSFADGLDLEISIKAEFSIPKAKLVVLSPKNAGRLLDAGISRGLKNAEPAVMTRLDEAMKSTIWRGHTPEESYNRLNGETVYTRPRNIVDTGALMGSGSTEVQGTTLSVTYKSPYASITYYGGVIHPYGNSKASSILPPKPWIEAALKGMGSFKPFNFQPYINQGLKGAWRSL